MKLNQFSLIVLLLALLGFMLPTAVLAEADGVTVKDKQVYVVQDGHLTPLTENLEFPSEITVSTNGTFRIGKDGQDRQIADGQLLRRDGWLVNADGSVTPAVDHVVMSRGQVCVVRDGESTALDHTMVFTNGMTVNPQGFGSQLPGGQLRLADGQLFRLDGTPIPARDTISMKDGRVVVQKSGTLIPLASVQIMGMADGTRVHGDGRVVKPDGTTIQLQEGQTILVEGIKYGR